ncbi:hypothetical protein AWC38_SpisGene23897 [Stylophora pistillata]|uniref:Uncharacterized protein n=1 Tax=Stylophora pistillata TaxID=50429 RepID=A0A2B4R5U5_STYPI|nr:hypothetical protein AWC38_SpisGene23897 [Stylophora pistillata]
MAPKDYIPTSSSDSEVSEMIDYDLEVDGSPNSSSASSDEEGTHEAYGEDPLADEEWIGLYERDRKEEEVLERALQKRLNVDLGITKIEGGSSVNLASLQKNFYDYGAYGSVQPLPTPGTFTADVKQAGFKDRSEADLVVVEGDGRMLLGCETAKALNLLCVCPFQANSVDGGRPDGDVKKCVKTRNWDECILPSYMPVKDELRLYGSEVTLRNEFGVELKRNTVFVKNYNKQRDISDGNEYQVAQAGSAAQVNEAGASKIPETIVIPMPKGILGTSEACENSQVQPRHFPD